jgi:SET domain-containing protein
MMYRPLPKELTIKESPIEGLGLFALVDIEAGHEFGITHYHVKTSCQCKRCHEIFSFPDSCVRTPLGGFYNHSKHPNCETFRDGDFRILRAIKGIKAGEELTSFYYLYSMEEE